MDSGMGGMEHTTGYTHMTFFWGKDSEILFSGWPGSSGGMYTLALMIVFVLAVLVEWFNFFVQVVSPRWSHMVARLVQTAMHAVRVALAYFVMLAVMSFNGGVLIAAILGHALGFFLFGTAALKRSAGCAVGNLPPIAC